eukprot:CAMPEP_0118935502 /NCGR_PEP_ID=MMETSP1169-20130426/15678_1 /TAXON_ID=36882 /ORGANISM="Pyramimonas obovata, Strain CCMP722" /LENGTH=61 /DNA_ID=CAMNT_0006878547 /DNA_START=1160 /DNA_END=1345 /DNA_ORIENTATION=+
MPFVHRSTAAAGEFSSASGIAKFDDSGNPSVWFRLSAWPDSERRLIPGHVVSDRSFIRLDI